MLGVKGISSIGYFCIFAIEGGQSYWCVPLSIGTPHTGRTPPLNKLIFTPSLMNRYILSLLLVGLSTLTALGQKVMPLENNDGSVLPKELPRKGTLYLKDTHRLLPKYAGSWEGDYKGYKLYVQIEFLERAPYATYAENCKFFVDQLHLVSRILDASGREVMNAKTNPDRIGVGGELFVRRPTNASSVEREETYQFVFFYNDLSTGVICVARMSDDMKTLTLELKSVITMEGPMIHPEYLPQEGTPWVLRRTSKVPPRSALDPDFPALIPSSK